MSLDTWHELDDRTRTRKCNSIETRLTLGDGRRPIHVYMGATVSGLEGIKDLHGSLRAAWLEARFRYPLIAASNSIDEQGVVSFVYKSPKSDEEVSAWADRTIIQQQKPIGEVALWLLNSPSRAEQTSIDQAFLWTSELENGRLELVFGGNHAVADGRSCRVVVNSVAQYLKEHLDGPASKKYAWGEEFDRLPLEPALLGGFREPGERKPSADDDKLKADFLALAPKDTTALKLPVKPCTFDTTTGFIRHLFTVEETSRFVAARKAFQATVSEVMDILWAAALLVRLYNDVRDWLRLNGRTQLPEEERSKASAFSLTFGNAVDQRRYIDEKYRQIVSTMMGVLPTHFVLKPDEIKRAEQIINDESGPVPKWLFDVFIADLKKQSSPLHWPRYPAITNDLNRPPAVTSMKMQSEGGMPTTTWEGSLFHTSLGRIEDVLARAGQKCHLDEILPLMRVNFSCLVAGTQTVSGRLLLHVTWGEGTVPSELAHGLLDDVVKLVKRISGDGLAQNS